MAEYACRLVYHGMAFFEMHVKDGPLLFIDPCIAENRFATVRVEDLPRPDAVLVTHLARDHYGDAPAIVTRHNVQMYGPGNVRAYAAIQGVDASLLRGMRPGHLRRIGNVTVKALETRHHSFFNNKGVFMSDVALSFLITLPNGCKVYHMGDSALSADLKMYGEVYHPDVILIGVGGAFEDSVGDLDPEEAALATEWLGAKLAIPMHYDLINDQATPQQYAHELERRGVAVRVVTLAAGEGLDLEC
jgi:L-ascorbate metabolism protein UlaG (beta-lactamase superfamily)